MMSLFLGHASEEKVGVGGEERTIERWDNRLALRGSSWPTLAALLGDPAMRKPSYRPGLSLVAGQIVTRSAWTGFLPTIVHQYTGHRNTPL